jgi:hypothetical protein
MTVPGIAFRNNFNASNNLLQDTAMGYIHHKTWDLLFPFFREIVFHRYGRKTDNGKYMLWRFV